MIFKKNRPVSVFHAATFLSRHCLAVFQLFRYQRIDELIWVKTNQLQRIIRTGRTGHWLNHGKEHCLVGSYNLINILLPPRRHRPHRMFRLGPPTSVQALHNHCCMPLILLWVCKVKQFQKSKITLEVGPGLTRILCVCVGGKSSQNSPKLVLILWASIPCVFCLYVRYKKMLAIMI